MFNRNYLILIAICFILITNSLFSQIILQGTVTDNGGEYLGNGAEPVINALVTITDQADDSRTFSSYTDEQGQYSIQFTQTDVDDDPSVTPVDFRLLQNYPNPFNPSTVIGYEISKPSHFSIEIYNVLGQRVKTLLDGFQSSSGQVVWNATNDLGQGVPAGVYIYSMQAAGMRVNRKMLLIDGQQGSIQTAAAPSGSAVHTGNSVINKQMSDQYLLEVTGENIAHYKQQDLEIMTNMIVDVIVIRTLTDFNGNVYQTVKIGDQWWMKENLKVPYYANGDTIPNVTDISEWTLLSTGAYCAFNNVESNADTYGYLYNWYAVDDSRNIAPEGWHVPTDEEWKELEMCLGLSQSEADASAWRGTDEGGKLKEVGTTHWNSPNTGATDESGFYALPGGYRGGSDNAMGRTASFRTSTEYGGSDAYVRFLTYDHSEIDRGGRSLVPGYSVRCVKD